MPRASSRASSPLAARSGRVVEVMHLARLTPRGSSPRRSGLLLVSYLAIYYAVWAVAPARRRPPRGMSAASGSRRVLGGDRVGAASIGGGFPWALLGASQASVLPIVQLASVAGVYGLSALVALVSTAAAAVSLTRRRRHLAVGVAVVVVRGRHRRFRRIARGEDGPRFGRNAIRVGLVQGSVGPGSAKYDTAIRAGDHRSLPLMRDAWPRLRPRDLARGVDAVLFRRGCGRRRADPPAGAGSAHAVHHRHRRARATRRPADRYFNCGRARWPRRPIAARLPQDPPRAVRRVRAVQAAAVLRRSAGRGGVRRFQPGDARDDVCRSTATW